MFAATLTLPFLGATLGLLRHNWCVDSSLIALFQTLTGFFRPCTFLQIFLYLRHPVCGFSSSSTLFG